MNNMPANLRKECAADPAYRTCMRNAALHDHECQPDPLQPWKLLEWEHALIFAAKQIQEKYAVISSCWWAHRGAGLVKEINVWIALNRATDQQLKAISKAVDYIRMRNRLNEKYGPYVPPVESGIDY